MKYAARAGADGDIASSEIQRVAQLGTDATQPVEQKEPNGWRLYDMLGNVWESVADTLLRSVILTRPFVL